MENATNALLMAGGVLIGILILSLAVYLFTTFGGTTAKVNDQNAQVQLTQFNAQFTKYEGITTNTIYDIITVVGLAKENNKYYDNDTRYKITVTMPGEPNLMGKESREELINGYSDYTYNCEISYDDVTGRVKKVRFY